MHSSLHLSWGRECTSPNAVYSLNYSRSSLLTNLVRYIEVETTTVRVRSTARSCRTTSGVALHGCISRFSLLFVGVADLEVIVVVNSRHTCLGRDNSVA